jgi:hypothetical protein
VCLTDHQRKKMRRPECVQLGEAFGLERQILRHQLADEYSATVKPRRDHAVTKRRR